MHQYAYNPLGKTVHSSGQLSHFGNLVNEKSMKVEGGTQSILTGNGDLIPLDIVNELAQMCLRPYTDAEW